MDREPINASVRLRVDSQSCQLLAGLPLFDQVPREAEFTDPKVIIGAVHEVRIEPVI